MTSYLESLGLASVELHVVLTRDTTTNYFRPPFSLRENRLLVARAVAEGFHENHQC